MSLSLGRHYERGGKKEILYNYLTMESPSTRSEVLLQAKKYIKLKYDKWKGLKEKAREAQREAQPDASRLVERPKFKPEHKRFYRV